MLALYTGDTGVVLEADPTKLLTSTSFYISSNQIPSPPVKLRKQIVDLEDFS